VDKLRGNSGEDSRAVEEETFATLEDRMERVDIVVLDSVSTKLS